MTGMDYDDIYVANQNGANALYINDGSESLRILRQPPELRILRELPKESLLAI